MSQERKRSFVKVNEEDLIKAIKDHPELYDCTNKSFKRHSARASAWTKIAHHVNLSEHEAKKRWRSLRDGFIKHVKHTPEEARGSMLHYDLLKFLTPYVTGEHARTRAPAKHKLKEEMNMSNVIYIRKSQNGATEIIPVVPVPYQKVEHESMEEMDILEEQHITSDQLEQIEISEVEATSGSHLETVKVKLNSTEDSTETYTIEETPDHSVKFQRSYQETEYGPDEKFLLSLAPTLKRLSVKKNVMARIKIQQLLFELEFDEQL